MWLGNLGPQLLCPKQPGEQPPVMRIILNNQLDPHNFSDIHTQTLNEWHMYLQLAILYGECRYIYHTLCIWDRPCLQRFQLCHTFQDVKKTAIESFGVYRKLVQLTARTVEGRHPANQLRLAVLSHYFQGFNIRPRWL